MMRSKGLLSLCQRIMRGALWLEFQFVLREHSANNHDCARLEAMVGRYSAATRLQQIRESETSKMPPTGCRMHCALLRMVE
eukprot:5524195-Amphidinium_carterae.1